MRNDVKKCLAEYIKCETSSFIQFLLYFKNFLKDLLQTYNSPYFNYFSSSQTDSSISQKLEIDLINSINLQSFGVEQLSINNILPYEAFDFDFSYYDLALCQLVKKVSREDLNNQTITWSDSSVDDSLQKPNIYKFILFTYDSSFEAQIKNEKNGTPTQGTKPDNILLKLQSWASDFDIFKETLLSESKKQWEEKWKLFEEQINIGNPVHIPGINGNFNEFQQTPKLSETNYSVDIISYEEKVYYMYCYMMKLIQNEYSIKSLQGIDGKQGFFHYHSFLKERYESFSLVRNYIFAFIYQKIDSKFSMETDKLLNSLIKTYYLSLRKGNTKLLSKFFLFDHQMNANIEKDFHIIQEIINTGSDIKPKSLTHYNWFITMIGKESATIQFYKKLFHSFKNEYNNNNIEESQYKHFHSFLEPSTKINTKEFDNIKYFQAIRYNELVSRTKYICNLHISQNDQDNVISMIHLLKCFDTVNNMSFLFSVKEFATFISDIACGVTKRFLDILFACNKAIFSKEPVIPLEYEYQKLFDHLLHFLEDMD